VRARSLAVLVASCALAIARSARAEDVAAAAAAFDRGLADMKAGRYDTGCPALAESHRLDPKPGALFTLAECEAKRGRVATAMTHYRDLVAWVARLPPAQATKHVERERVAKERIAELAKQVPELTLELTPNAPGGLVVTRDGVTLGPALLGVPLPIDPGEHVVAVRAADGRARETRVTLALGERRRLALEPPATSARAAPASVLGAPAGTSSQRTWGFVVGGAGVAGIVTGAVLGGLAWSKKSAIDDGCQGPVCTPAGKAAADEGQAFALGSSVAFPVGAALTAAGVIVVLTAPKRAATGAVRVTFAATPRAAFVTGDF
jgi:hypothetical protein